MTKDQLQVVLGTVIGDGSLIPVKNHVRLSLCHCEKQLDYLKFKMEAIGLFKSEPFHYQSGKYSQYHAHSTLMNEEIKELRGLFYNRGVKFIDTKILKKLEPTAILIWHLDDGSVIKSSGNTFVWCTDSFSLGEVQAIKKWLWKTHKVQSFLLESKGGYSDKTYWRLRFRKEGSIALNEIMKKSPLYDLVPESMKYKLPY